ITTHVVRGPQASWVQRTWLRVAEEVAAGGQVYVVCPRIGAEDDPDLPEGTTIGPGGPIEDEGAAAPVEPGAQGPTENGASGQIHGVLQVVRALRELPATAGLRIGVLHGRQSTEEKDAVMRAFTVGELDVLVATTVIE